MVQQIEGSVDHLPEIVRRNIGRHSDSDSHAAVDQKIRELRRQNFRFRFTFVKVRNHVDGILVEIGKKLFSHPFHPAFRVTGGRGRVAVDRSEISLSFNQRGPHGEGLGQTHQRIVDGGVSVRMIFSP